MCNKSLRKHSNQLWEGKEVVANWALLTADIENQSGINDQTRQHVKEQRHYFANKGPSSQGYGFSNSPEWM